MCFYADEGSAKLFQIEKPFEVLHFFKCLYAKFSFIMFFIVRIKLLIVVNTFKSVDFLYIDILYCNVPLAITKKSRIIHK